MTRESNKNSDQSGHLHCLFKAFVVLGPYLPNEHIVKKLYRLRFVDVHVVGFVLEIDNITNALQKRISLNIFYSQLHSHVYNIKHNTTN